VPRLTLDTNILISAVAFGGNSARIVEKALSGDVEIFISDEILRNFPE
jgi:predicted nucleic acid-binding protein